jgi:AbrB family looped-hinge helix DNA binding protein
MSTTAVVGKRGTLIIPSELRRRHGLSEGSLVLIDETDHGLTLRPALALPLEIYTPERKAAFLLENAIGEHDYLRAVEEVRKLGLDPTKVPHQRP